jgi:ubiquinol-cytochrome c reductase cytochrome c subunit
MTARALTGAVLAALVLPALAGASVPPPYGIVDANAPRSTPLRELGYQLYAGNCSTCHGPNGEGIYEARPGLGSGGILGLGPSLRDVGELAPDFYLRTGRMPLGRVGDQPNRGKVFFSDRQIRALVAYVGSLGNGPPIPKPHAAQGKLNEGLELFTQHCAGCHQIGAAGGYLPAAVAPDLGSATPTQIAEAVRIGPYVMPRFPEKAISNAQLDSIVRYVVYARHPNDAGGWSLGHIGPIPEGLVTWLIAAALLVAVCLVLAKRLKSE